MRGLLRPVSGIALAWLAVLTLAALALAAPAAAAEPQSVKGLHLGMSLPEGEVEGVYQGLLAGEVADSVGLTFPYDHIETRLNDGSRLSLHFTSPAGGTRLFWVRLATSWHWPEERPSPPLETLLGDYRARFGEPTRQVGANTGEGDMLLLFAAPGTGADLPAEIPLAPEEIGGVQFMSFQQRVALLGESFSGAVVSIVVRDGKVAAVVEELVDHVQATTVLNPGG